jgi:hypothetical protein
MKNDGDRISSWTGTAGTLTLPFECVFLVLFTESYPNQAIVSSPLATTNIPGVTTATAGVTLNPGFSKGFVTASWTQ